MVIKVKEIDLRNIDYTNSEIELITNQLKKDKIYRPTLLYRGFNGERLEDMLKYGTDNPKSDLIYCAHEEDFKEDELSYNENPLNHAVLKEIPALAVYDESKLRNELAYQFRFIDSTNKKEALLAVYLLKYHT